MPRLSVGHGLRNATSNSANAIIDDCRVRFHAVIARQVECLVHGVNVSICKERTNVGLKACHDLRFGTATRFIFLLLVDS